MSSGNPLDPTTTSAPDVRSVQPIPFQSDFEQIPDDEGETTQGLIDALRAILDITYADYHHAVRAVHAKCHGIVRGEMEVHPDLPATLAQGLFAKAGRYPLVMRFSTNPGDILDDHVSTPRGLAIKIIGAEGPRLSGSEGDVTQDLVMQNAPAFTAPTPKAFLKNLKLLAKTTDKAPGMKNALSAVLRGTEHALEAVGTQSPTIKSLGGHPKTHILGETFYTVVPLLYGDYYAKISVAPVSENLTSLTGQEVDLDGKPDGLREALVSTVAAAPARWEVRVQLATGIEQFPIEDASKIWPEDVSPYLPVAHITIDAQSAWNDDVRARVDDGMSFSPWHGLAAHRPLGGIMRTRKAAYEMSAGFRSKMNHCPFHEPRSLD